MLEVQKYLVKNSPEKLTEEFGIIVNRHPTDSRFILNYCQINSYKHRFHPIVQECRGLVLDDSNNVVCKSFNRFYNLGENDISDSLFTWHNFRSAEKVDGSLIILYFYNGQWNINTRNSWGDGLIHPDFNFTWSGLVFDLLKKYQVDLNKLSPFNSYIFELCSRYNKVVRDYSEPCLFYLSAFSNHSCLEIDYKLNEVPSPGIYNFKSIDEILEYINKNTDKTFEGFVIRDCENRRIKIKSPNYLRLHKLRGENPANCKKNLIPFILKGCDETDELLQYFKEFKDLFNKINNI
jgi:hypothetical protein